MRNSVDSDHYMSRFFFEKYKRRGAFHKKSNPNYKLHLEIQMENYWYSQESIFFIILQNIYNQTENVPFSQAKGEQLWQDMLSPSSF